MNLKDFKIAPFYDLDKNWALVAVGNKENYNAMTISWGGFGTLWHKPVVTVYIRKSRYTHELLLNEEYFTINFFNEDKRPDLGILGSKSGRDGDKIGMTSLNVDFYDEYPTFKEANLTIICKKIFNQDVNLNNIPEEYKDKFYQDNDIHEMFIGEVVDIIDKRIG